MNGPVTTAERYSLREAYSRLASVPDGVQYEWPILLDRRGLLHSQQEAQDGTYVIDDDPRLSEAASEQDVPVSFADTAASGSLRFYDKSGVKTLRLAAQRVDVAEGESIPTPAGLNVNAVLRRLHSADFATAVAALAEYELKTESGSKALLPLILEGELKARSSVEFVKELRIKYRVAGYTVEVPGEIVLKGDRFVCVEVSNMSALRGLVSSAVSSLLTEDISLQRTLADSIYRLLDSSTPIEMERYLKGRGIPWTPRQQPVHRDVEDGSQEESVEQQEDGVRDYVVDMLAEDFTREPPGEVNGRSGGQTTTSPPNSSSPTPTEATQTATRQLPPIGQVSVRALPGGGSLPIRGSSAAASGGSSGRWVPPTPEQEARDRQIGRRGEEIIYRREVAKVKALGLDESKVIWVSDSIPGADHDILSIDEDGHSLWIEVKSTTGRDGRFRWSKTEFDRARKHRDRYVLYRVYEADTCTPSVRDFRDPVGLLLNDAMRLNISSLHAEVAALS